MPKRRRTLFLVLLLLILSIGAGNYGSYCTNRWGQQTLLLQYLFAPYCPASSQAARYAPFEVLVPAASDPYFLAISPSGRFVLYAEQQPKYQGVLINIENGQRTTINIPNVTWAFF